jgi:signal transduction histidine kinase
VQGAQSATGGLGIGLAVVRGIVELHNGRVSVASDGLGSGTTFTVTLPLAAVAPGGGPEWCSPAVSG